VCGLSLTAVQGIDKRIEKTALTLGANSFQTILVTLIEERFAIFSAIIAGFGRVFGEVGISMMLGGNIKGFTRNITTAIAFETGKGEFGLGIGLGIILLVVAFSMNILFHYFQGKKV
jgi:tungstate transport system permease protein